MMDKRQGMLFVVPTSHCNAVYKCILHPVNVSSTIVLITPMNWSTDIMARRRPTPTHPGYRALPK